MARAWHAAQRHGHAADCNGNRIARRQNAAVGNRNLGTGIDPQAHAAAGLFFRQLRPIDRDDARRCADREGDPVSWQSRCQIAGAICKSFAIIDLSQK